ncbi:MAG TPA: DMT family transporter, partial [Burkholderiales bacterium]
NPVRRAVLALAVLAVIWGYNWVVMKEVLKYAGPLDFGALRNLLGALSLFAALALLRRPLKPVAPGWMLVLGLLQTTTFTCCVMLALAHGGAGRAAVLTYTMPFWLLLLAWPLLGERVHGLQWPAAAMALAGLLLIMEPWRIHGGLATGLLATGAGIVWAVSNVIVKRLRARMEIDLLRLSAWQMLFGSVALGVIAALYEQRSMEWTPYLAVALAYNAIPATALAWLLWVYVLHHLPAGAAGLGSLAIPVVGVLSAAIELGERPSTTETAGMALILAALAVLSVQALREHRRDDIQIVQD